MNCVGCADDLDHCHGTLIIHTTGLTECTGHECVDLELIRHTLIVDCESVLAGCLCTGEPEPERLRKVS